MRDRSSAVLRRVLTTFNSFTAGQKVYVADSPGRIPVTVTDPTQHWTAGEFVGMQFIDSTRKSPSPRAMPLGSPCSRTAGSWRAEPRRKT